MRRVFDLWTAEPFGVEGSRPELDRAEEIIDATLDVTEEREKARLAAEEAKALGRPEPVFIDIETLIADAYGCSYEFSVTAGTIMHDSHLPLRKWFVAIYLMCESKKGISALQLQRTLGIGSYRTAWYLNHRIREAMANDPFEGPTLLGVVEVDETMVGGKAKGKDYRRNKTWVAGAIQRDGQVRLERIPNIRKRTLHDFIARTVHDQAEAIYTDELKSYLGIADHDTQHATVNHRAEQWVVGDVHVNSIEGGRVSSPSPRRGESESARGGALAVHLPRCRGPIFRDTARLWR